MANLGSNFASIWEPPFHKNYVFSLKKENNQKILEAISLETGDYSPSKKINLNIDTIDLKTLINKEL